MFVLFAFLFIVLLKGGVYLFSRLEDWGPYRPPTSSTCGEPAGALRARTAVLYTMGPFGPPLRAPPPSRAQRRRTPIFFW